MTTDSDFKISKGDSSLSGPWPALARSEDTVGADLLKTLLECTIGKDTDKKQEDGLRDCAELFRTSVMHESDGARAVPPEIMLKVKVIN